MKEDHEKGYCHCCHKEAMVRWKNIYHRGSEGLWICQPCENKVVCFVQELSREATLAKKEAIRTRKVKDGRLSLYCGISLDEKEDLNDRLEAWVATL